MTFAASGAIVGTAVYVLLRGSLVGEYPYPVLDVNEHGFGGVMTNALFLLAALVILNTIAVLVDRTAAKSR